MSNAIQATGSETFAGGITTGASPLDLIDATTAASKPYVIEHVWLQAGATGLTTLSAGANIVAGTNTVTLDVVANGIFVDRLALTVSAAVVTGFYSVTVRYL